ncbi:hypothetical protein [Neptuniibacter sp. 2_MG-2023]|uniref:hypothetical protein n=1 Tax=Neptuniibacter sp. 2_MG-2023 TaxID=3062671 RepID=UPI0026E2E889|nr:hypothetical protein [Neptuniibacter sp. 2_MG-2023]MDO6513789.1 hypothetical protein [Neptuniibacter sp. 2_MG-2023]
MQSQGYQLQVNSIGDANALTISAAHQHFGLSKQECIQRILTSPSILQSNLSQERASQLKAALSDFKLPCEIVGNDVVINTDTTQYELAAHIKKFDHAAEFAAEIAAFTGQTGEEIVKSLTQVPAILLGRLSKTVAADLIRRFSKPGIELVASAPATALYTVMAFMPSYNESIRSQYISLGLKPNSNEVTCKQWSANNLSYSSAQDIWQKATSLHLPVIIQNHDYFRFNLTLDSVSSELDFDSFSNWLTEQFSIPEKIHRKLIDSLPIVLERSIPLENAQTHLAAMYELGCQGSAISVAGEKYNIEFKNLTSNTQQALSNLLNSIMGRTILLPVPKEGTSTIPLAANIHQAQWITHEAKKAGLMARLIPTTESKGQ